MTDTATSTYYLAEVPSSGLSIRLHLGVVERLEREVLDTPRRPGDEVGGILLGTVLDSGRSVVVEDYQTVTTCLRKERFYDSDRDRGTLERAIALWQPDPNSNIYAIGFFRSDNRSNPKPEDGDRNSLSSHLPQSDSVLLLIGAGRDKSAAAALYYAERGQIRRRSPCLRFPFKRSELVEKSAGQQHPDNGKGRTALQIVRRQQQDSTPSAAPRGVGLSLLRWVLITMAAAGLLAAALFEYRVANLLTSRARVESRPSSALGLRTERNHSELLLSWDPAASAMATAARGHLSIADGQAAKELDLEAGELRRGRIAYAPVTDDVTFRLEVFDAGSGKSVVESLRVLSGAPPVLAAGSRNGLPPPTVQSVNPRAVASPAGESALPAVPNRPPAVSPAPGGATPGQARRPAGRIAQAVMPPAPEIPAEEVANRPTSAAPSPPSAPKIPAQIPAAPPASAAPPPPPAAASVAARSVAPVLPRPGAGVLAPRSSEVGGRAEAAVAIRKTLPVYPQAALLGRISGVVRVMATIARDGTVKNVRALDGPVLLRDAAVTAVQRWQYKPALLNGSPVEISTVANVVFRLNN